MKTVSSKT